MPALPAPERIISPARRAAYEVLLRVFEQEAYADRAFRSAAEGLDDRERAFAQRLAYGSVQRVRTLDHAIGTLGRRPVRKLDPPVRAALRLGAYQLLSGMSPHAAVGETVGVVPARARGFTNGALRALARTGPPFRLPDGDGVAAIGVRTSHPDWIVQTFVDELGHDAALATLALDNEPPPVTLRVNPMRTTADDVARELREQGVDVEVAPLVPRALLARHTGDLGALDAVRGGRVTPQDQSSQAVVAALDPQPGERMLDVAAAPGGKAMAVAERMNGDGLVVAADLHPARVRAIARAAARLGLDAVSPLAADGRRLPVRDASFDRVLLDAPCTGLGVLRRRPDARWRVQSRDVGQLAALQRDLLTCAARAVRPGGRLVYSVCTLTRMETLAVDAFAASELPELVALEPPGQPWRPHGRGALLVPSAAGTDGMFVLVLERSR